MSTGSLGRRLFIAALGVASLTAAVYYIVAERRRRKPYIRIELNEKVNQEKNRVIPPEIFDDKSDTMVNLKISSQIAVIEPAIEPIALVSKMVDNQENNQESIAVSTSTDASEAEHDSVEKMVSAEDQYEIHEPVAETTNQNGVNNLNFVQSPKSVGTNSTTHQQLSSNGHAKENGLETYANVKQQNGFYSQANNSDHRPKSPVTSLKSKTDKLKFSSHPSKNETKMSPRKDATLTPLPAENGGYQNAESPSGTSTNSDGSADSGRATGGPNCSPFDNHGDIELKPVYEFEVPNTLVGLIIGIQGKTITELCRRASVRMLIRPHHTAARFETHQICSIEGPRNNINKCLHMIRYRFPTDRFPDLNLKPVLPPTVLECTGQMIGNEPSTLSLPVGVPCEAFICNVVDPGHFFVQLPTHPTFSSLTNLDYYTMNIYSHLSGIPVLPKPCVGVVCIAPTPNGWFRAITLDHNEIDDTVIVRLADYGGFLQLPRSELRQIRSDLTSLPMQAIECYLAHVQPADGTAYWSNEATEAFTKLCASRIVQAELVGYNKENNIPFIEIYATDEDKKVRRVDTVILERGYAKPADPTKMIPVQPVGKPNSYRKSTLSESSNRR